VRYIQKQNEPDFFTKKAVVFKNYLLKTNNKKKVWRKYGRYKRKLKEFILKNEQNYLCCYCECKVNLNNSHLEHIKPKSLDYDNLTFDYNNILVSCQGNIFSNSNRENTCGHCKDDRYDDAKFLDPTKVKNIREYFKYDISSGKIEGTDDKSRYMIGLLNLNDSLNNLPKARIDSYETLLEYIEKSNISKDKLKKIFEKEDLEFISFLRYVFGEYDGK